MKQTIIALVAAITISASALAQQDSDKQKERKHIDKTEMVKIQTERMVKLYGLNEEQAQKLLEVNTKYSDKMRPQRNGRHEERSPQVKAKKEKMPKDSLRQQKRPADRMKMFNEMKKNRKAYEAEVKQIMTEEQFKKFSDDASKREKRMHEGKGHKRNR